MLAVCQGIVSCFHSASSGSGTAQERLFGVQPKAQGLVSLWLPLSPKGDPSKKVSRAEQSAGCEEADFEPGEADLARPLDFDEPPSCQRRGMWASTSRLVSHCDLDFDLLQPLFKSGFIHKWWDLSGLMLAQSGRKASKEAVVRCLAASAAKSSRHGSNLENSAIAKHIAGCTPVQNAQRCQVATCQKGSNHENMTCAEEIYVLRRLAGYKKSSFNHECGWPPWNPLDQQSDVFERFVKPLQSHKGLTLAERPSSEKGAYFQRQTNVNSSISLQHILLTCHCQLQIFLRFTQDSLNCKLREAWPCSPVPMEPRTSWFRTFPTDGCYEPEEWPTGA